MLWNNQDGRLAGLLLPWYAQHARELPWREGKDPYRIWVSEIMLQQTRIEAVMGYYGRFVKALPQIRDLAECPSDQLLKLWEGLGYYNRVRNMQKAAVVMCRDHQGNFPGDYETILSLPGIGEYTAGAIASIAFGIPVPAVDGNVLRVMSRVCASRENILQQSVKRTVRDHLQTEIPAEAPGEFNQALMEVGETICIPSGRPLCGECPLAAVCESRKMDLTDEIPVRIRKTGRRTEQMTVFLITDGKRFLLRKREENGLLAGLYEFPHAPGHLTWEQAEKEAVLNGCGIIEKKDLPPARHLFSHVEWRMTGYLIRVEELKLPGFEYLAADLLHTQEEIPVPSAFSAYLSALHGLLKSAEKMIN